MTHRAISENFCIHAQQTVFNIFAVYVMLCFSSFVFLYLSFDFITAFDDKVREGVDSVGSRSRYPAAKF